MAFNEPEKPKSIKNGITYTRDFEVVEMSDLSEPRGNQFTVTTSYSVTTASRPRAPHKKSMGHRFVESFRRAPGGLPMTGNHGYQINDDLPEIAQAGNRFYDLRAANVRTANSALARDLKGRHLQMIAFGGSIGIVISLLLKKRKSLNSNITNQVPVYLWHQVWPCTKVDQPRCCWLTS
jgi:hypothetical protein